MQSIFAHRFPQTYIQLATRIAYHEPYKHPDTRAVLRHDVASAQSGWREALAPAVPFAPTIIPNVSAVTFIHLSEQTWLGSMSISLFPVGDRGHSLNFS